MENRAVFCWTRNRNENLPSCRPTTLCWNSVVHPEQRLGNQELKSQKVGLLNTSSRPPKYFLNTSSIPFPPSYPLSHIWLESLSMCDTVRVWFHSPLNKVSEIDVRKPDGNASSNLITQSKCHFCWSRKLASPAAEV